MDHDYNSSIQNSDILNENANIESIIEGADNMSDESIEFKEGMYDDGLEKVL